MRKALSILFVLLLVAPLMHSATKRTAKKTTATTAKKPSVKKPAAKSSSRASSSSKKKKRSSRTARARRTGPPRQATPTPERYMEIQQALAAKGYYDGQVDGTWDADCVAALKKFQADQNLAPDGKLGALSLIALGLGPKREPPPPQFVSKPEPSQLPN